MPSILSYELAVRQMIHEQPPGTRFEPAYLELGQLHLESFSNFQTRQKLWLLNPQPANYAPATHMANRTLLLRTKLHLHQWRRGSTLERPIFLPATTLRPGNATPTAGASAAVITHAQHVAKHTPCIAAARRDTGARRSARASLSSLHNAWLAPSATCPQTAQQGQAASAAAPPTESQRLAPGCWQHRRDQAAMPLLLICRKDFSNNRSQRITSIISPALAPWQPSAP